MAWYPARFATVVAGWHSQEEVVPPETVVLESSGTRASNWFKPSMPSKHEPLAPLVLVTGKGGVGKTTVAAALTLVALEQKQGAVFVEFGDGDSGRRALGADIERVKHIIIHPEYAVVRAAGPLIGSKVLARLVLGNFAIRRLLRATPAIRELAMLESIRQIVAGHPRSRVVVDMPATGHGLGWLRLPNQVSSVTSPGPFRWLAERIGREIIAPQRCSVVVVTLPERLVLSETLDLCHAMATDVGLSTARVVINQVPQNLPDRALDDAQRLSKGTGRLASAARALAQVLMVRRSAWTQATSAIRDLFSADAVSPVLLPLSPADPPASDVACWFLEEGAG